MNNVRFLLSPLLLFTLIFASACEKEKLYKVAEGFKSVEGAATDGKGSLFISDAGDGKIIKVSSDGALSTFSEGVVRASRLAFDEEGYLLAGEPDKGRIVYVDSEGNIEVLADNYKGKPLNGPGDIWIDPKGGVYFTDPQHGDARGNTDGTGNVYYITPFHGKIIPVAQDLVRPAGIIGTPDGRLLYIGDAGSNNTYKYIINEDGTISSRELFAKVGARDMAIDTVGTVFIAAGAVFLVDIAGNHIETINLPEAPTGLSFGGSDMQTLFITTGKSLHSIHMPIRGF